MAKKTKSVTAPKSKSTATKATVEKTVSTPVRNSAIPKVVAMPAAKKAAPSFTAEDVSLRAYFISQSGNGGSENDNWLRAEDELRSGL